MLGRASGHNKFLGKFKKKTFPPGVSHGNSDYKLALSFFLFLLS